MKHKKHIILILVFTIILLSISTIFVFSNFKKEKSDIKNIDDKKQNIINNEVEKDETFPQEKEQEESTTTNNTTEEQIHKNDSNKQNVQKNDSTIKEETTTPPKVETNNNQEKTPEEKPKEETIPQVDEELERLKSLCETFSHKECFDKAGDVASSDVINIRNTSCEDVIYKGQVIGYRIIIFYNDGTWKYNNATD